MLLRPSSDQRPRCTEPTSPTCRSLWELADLVVSSRLLHVEAAAATAQARRLGRLTPSQHAAGRTALDRLCKEIDMVEIDATLGARAAALAFELALPGYDSVHCAAAGRVAGPEFVVASGDRRQLSALSAMGLETVDVNRAWS